MLSDSEEVDGVPPILGVSEIVLSVADLPAMRQFYVQVLGFPVLNEKSMESETHRPSGEPTISFLKIGDCDTPLGRHLHPQMLVLIDFQRHVYARERLIGHDVKRSTLNHLAFEISPEDYDLHLKRLQDRGIDVRFSEFPELCARAIFFNDPEGNLLELICHTNP